MTATEAEIQRLQELALQEARVHSQYMLGEPDLSDTQYDALVQETRVLVAKLSPEQRKKYLSRPRRY